MEETGLAPEVAAQPATSVTISALVQSELSPWRMDHAWRVNTVLAEGRAWPVWLVRSWRGRKPPGGSVRSIAESSDGPHLMGARPIR